MTVYIDVGGLKFHPLFTLEIQSKIAQQVRIEENVVLLNIFFFFPSSLQHKDRNRSPQCQWSMIGRCIFHYQQHFFSTVCFTTFRFTFPTIFQLPTGFLWLLNTHSLGQLKHTPVGFLLVLLLPSGFLQLPMDVCTNLLLTDFIRIDQITPTRFLLIINLCRSSYFN